MFEMKTKIPVIFNIQYKGDRIAFTTNGGNDHTNMFILHSLL